MKVLLICADDAIAQPMERKLKVEGFDSYTTDQGEEGIDLAKVYDYQAIVIAGEPEDLSALDLVRRMRAAKIAIPVMLLGKASSVEAVVGALNAGADDCLAMPFHVDELIARLHALIRRSAGQPSSVMACGPLEIDALAKVAKVNGEAIALTAKEYAILEFLALRKGQTQTKDVIMGQVYGGMDEPEMKIIDVFICKLRGKLRSAGVAGLVQTVWGRGYLLSEEPIKTPQKLVKARTGSRVRDRILDALTARPLSSRELRDALPDVNPNTISGVLHGLVVGHDVENVGRPMAALYGLRRKQVAA